MEAPQKIFQKTQCEVAWSFGSSVSGWEDRLLYSNCMETVAAWPTDKESVLWLLLLFYTTSTSCSGVFFSLGDHSNCSFLFMGNIMHSSVSLPWFAITLMWSIVKNFYSLSGRRNCNGSHPWQTQMRLSQVFPQCTHCFHSLFLILIFPRNLSLYLPLSSCVNTDMFIYESWFLGTQ